jgi:hypothetical protein
MLSIGPTRNIDPSKFSSAASPGALASTPESSAQLVVGSNPTAGPTLPNEHVVAYRVPPSSPEATPWCLRQVDPGVELTGAGTVLTTTFDALAMSRSCGLIRSLPSFVVTGRHPARAARRASLPKECPKRRYSCDRLDPHAPGGLSGRFATAMRPRRHSPDRHIGSVITLGMRAERLDG